MFKKDMVFDRDILKAGTAIRLNDTFVTTENTRVYTKSNTTIDKHPHLFMNVEGIYIVSECSMEYIKLLNIKKSIEIHVEDFTKLNSRFEIEILGEIS